MADEEDLLLVDLLTPENRRRDATMVTPQPTPTTPAVDQQPPQPTPAVDQQPTPTTPAVDQQPTQKTPAVDVDQRPQTLSPPPLNLSNFQHPPSSIESSHHSPHVPLRNQPRSLSFSSQQPQVGMDVPAGPTPAPPGKDAAAADAASVNPNNIIGGAGALNANTRATRQAMAQLTGTPTKPKPRYKEPTPEEDAKLVAAAEARGAAAKAPAAGTDVDVDMTAVADHDGDGDVNMEEKKQDDEAAASPDSAKELNDTINKIIGQPAPPASAKPVFSPDHPRSTPRRVSDVDRAKAESSNPNHPMPPYRTGSAKPQSNDSDHINASFSSQFKYIFRTSGLIVGADSREFDWNYPARAIVDDHGHESQPFIHRPCLVHELVGPYRAGSVTHDAPPLRFVPRWNQSSIADGKCLIYSGQAALGGEEYPRMDPESTLVEDQAAAVRKMKDCRNEMANFVTEVMGLEAEEDADKEAIRQKHRLLLIHIFQLQPDADINTHNIQRFVERTCDEQMSFEEETAAVFGVMKGRSLQVTRYIPLSMDPQSNANLFVNASDVDRYSGLIASTPQTRFAYPLGDTIPEMKESDIKGRQFAFEGLKFPYYHAETVTLINYKRRLPTRGDPGGPGHYECTYLASDYYDTTFNHPRCMSQPTVMLPAVYGHRPRHFLTPVLSAPLFEHLDKTIVADQSRYAKAGMIVKCIRSDTEYLVLATMIHIMSTAPEFEGVRHLTSKDDSDTIGRRAFDDFVQKAGSPMSMPVEKVLLLEIPPASTTTREAVQDFLDEISTDENLAQQRANFSVVPFERIVTVTQLPEVSKQRREEDGEPCELYVKGTDEVFKVRSFVARKLKLRDEFIDQAAAFLAEATDLVATVHALDQPNGDQSNDMVSRFRQFEAYISNPIRCQALVGYELSDVGVDRILDDTIWGGMDEKHEPMKAMNEWLEVTSEFATTPAAITEAAAKKPAAATPTAKKPAAKKPAAPKKPAATKYQKIVYTEPRVPLDSLDERTRSSVRRFEVPADGVTNVDSLTHWLATCALRLCCHYKSMRSFFSHYTEADSIYHLLYSHLDKLLRKLPPATPSNHEDYIPHYIDPQRRPLTKMSNISTFMNCLLSYLAKNDAQAYVLYHLAVDRHEFERKLGELDQPFRRDFPYTLLPAPHARFMKNRWPTLSLSTPSTSTPRAITPAPAAGGASESRSSSIRSSTPASVGRGEGGDRRRAPIERRPSPTSKKATRADATNVIPSKKGAKADAMDVVPPTDAQSKHASKRRRDRSTGAGDDDDVESESKKAKADSIESKKASAEAEKAREEARQAKAAAAALEKRMKDMMKEVEDMKTAMARQVQLQLPIATPAPSSSPAVPSSSPAAPAAARSSTSAASSSSPPVDSSSQPQQKSNAQQQPTPMDVDSGSTLPTSMLPPLLPLSLQQLPGLTHGLQLPLQSSTFSQPMDLSSIFMTNIQANNMLAMSRTFEDERRTQMERADAALSGFARGHVAAIQHAAAFHQQTQLQQLQLQQFQLQLQQQQRQQRQHRQG